MVALEGSFLYGGRVGTLGGLPLSTHASVPLVLALSLVALTAVPGAIARDASEQYTTGADVAASCAEDAIGGLLAANYGSVCLDVQPGESSVDVAIEDTYVQNVGGAIEFEDANGEAIGELVSFCGSIADVSIPAGTERIEVFVNGPVFQFTECQSLGTSTTGEVTASFA